MVRLSSRPIVCVREAVLEPSLGSVERKRLVPEDSSVAVVVVAVGAAASEAEASAAVANTDHSDRAA